MVGPAGGRDRPLTGQYCPVTSSRAIAALRPVFVDLARQLGLTDFDAAALKDGPPRALTQAVATHLYELGSTDGVQFPSRLGDDHLLWAIVERPEGGEVSHQLADCSTIGLTCDNPDLQEALATLGLH